MLESWAHHVEYLYTIAQFYFPLWPPGVLTILSMSEANIERLHGNSILPGTQFHQVSLAD